MQPRVHPGMRHVREAGVTRWIRRPVAGRTAACLAMAGAVAACLGLPADLAAAPSAATLCIVTRGAIPGLEPEALDAALALEQRKRNIVVARTEAGQPESCPPVPIGQPRIVLVLGPGMDVVVIGPSGGSQPVAIRSLDRLDRARELARQAIGLVPGARDLGRMPLIEGPLPRLPQDVPVAARRPLVLRGYALAGGRYEYRSGNGTHAGGLDAELGLSILDGRFEVGARAGWLRAGGGSGATIPITLQAVPVELVARGGPRIDRVLLRLGATAGLEWRRLEVSNPPQRASAIHRTEVVASLGGEVEVAVDLVAGLRLALAGTVRGFPGGTQYTWQGEPAYESPRYAAGASLRLVAVFPGGGR